MLEIEKLRKKRKVAKGKFKMAILEIVKEGDSLLRQKSKPITKFGKELGVLFDDMYETMLKNNGCGIACPQVGVLMRGFIIDIEGQKMEFINPEISEMSGSCVQSEGCLSVPNRSEKVERPTHLRVKAFTREGTPFEFIANDFVARVICHENDHLDGILYIDKAILENKEK